MRQQGMMMAVLFLLTGALTMTDTATADDKKEEKKSPSKKESYDEKVTIKEWAGDKFGDPRDDVPAFRTEISGKTVIYIAPKPGIKSPVKSEIIDAKGDVWVVTESKRSSDNFTHYLNYVTKKP